MGASSKVSHGGQEKTSIHWPLTLGLSTLQHHSTFFSSALILSFSLASAFSFNYTRKADQVIQVHVQARGDQNWHNVFKISQNLTPWDEKAWSHAPCPHFIILNPLHLTHTNISMQQTFTMNLTKKCYERFKVSGIYILTIGHTNQIFCFSDLLICHRMFLAITFCQSLLLYMYSI